VRETGENYTTLHNILQPRKGKEVGPTKMGQELGLQVTGSGKYGPPGLTICLCSPVMTNHPIHAGGDKTSYMYTPTIAASCYRYQIKLQSCVAACRPRATSP